jgi:hypothetical protein
MSLLHFLLRVVCRWTKYSFSCLEKCCFAGHRSVRVRVTMAEKRILQEKGRGQKDQSSVTTDRALHIFGQKFGEHNLVEGELY